MIRGEFVVRNNEMKYMIIKLIVSYTLSNICFCESGIINGL